MSDKLQANAGVEGSVLDDAVGDGRVEQEQPAAVQIEAVAAMVEEGVAPQASSTGVSAAERRSARQRKPEPMGFEGDQAMPFDRLALSGAMCMRIKGR